MIYKFFKMAIANLFRYGTRTALTAIGLALAIAVVLFVNVVALSFESGTAEVYRYLRGTEAGIANVWVTPPLGFDLNRSTGFFTTDGTLSEALADQVLQASSGKGTKAIAGLLSDSDATPIVIYGRSDRRQASFSPVAASALKASSGGSLMLNNVAVSVEKIGSVPDVGAGGLVELPLVLAQKILKKPSEVNWVMLASEDVPALRGKLAQQNLLITTEPTEKAKGQQAIAYLLEDKIGRGDLVTFDVKLAAKYFNQASATMLGWLAKITLGLGFVLMLSAALLSIEERRREFGILTAVGVAGDVLYLFLLESLVLFVGSTILGIALGILLLQVLTPALLNWGTVLKSTVLVICYLPPMIIFGSLVPAQQLLRKSPLELLRTAEA